MTVSPDESDSQQGRDGGSEFAAAQADVFEATGIDPQSRFIDLTKPSVRLHVIDHGESNEEPPVVFLHGTGGFGAFFAPLMAHLNDRRVIAIDRPSWGLSHDFVYTTENLRQTIGDVLVGVLDELGIDQADLVGNSGGGYWSMVFALTHPQRVRRLVLLGGVPTFPGTRVPVPLKLFSAPVLGRVLARLQTPSEENAIKFMELAGEGETIQRYPALITTMVAHDRIPRPSTVAASELKSLLSVRGWRSAIRLREEEIRSVRHSPLFIWGENDFLGTPNDVRHAIGLIPDARVEVVDAGHGPWLGLPEKCAGLIRDMTN